MTEKQNNHLPMETVVKTHQSNMAVISRHHEEAGLIDKLIDPGWQDFAKGKRDMARTEINFSIKSLKAIRNTQLQQYAEDANKRLAETRNEVRLHLAQQSAEIFNRYIQSVDELILKFEERLIESESNLEKLLKASSQSVIAERMREKHIERLTSMLDEFYELDDSMRRRLKDASKQAIDPATGDAI